MSNPLLDYIPQPGPAAAGDSGLSDADAIFSALIDTEASGPGAVSGKGAQGRAQIMPGTFKQYAVKGEAYDNEADRIRAARRKVDDDYQWASSLTDDPEQIKKLTAAAYFSGRGGAALWARGEGNKRNDGNLDINQYVDRFTSKIGKQVNTALGQPQDAGQQTGDDLLAGKSRATDPQQGVFDSVFEPKQAPAAKPAPEPVANPDLPDLSEWQNRNIQPSQASDYGMLAQPEQPESFLGAANRGFKTAFKQVPQMAAGAAAFLGDAMGSDWLKNTGLAYYEKASADMAKDQRPTDDLMTAIESGGLAKWFAYATGYSVAQLAQALATGGAGALLAKGTVQGLFKATGERAAQQAMKGMAAEAAVKASEAAAKTGAEATVAKALGDKAFAGVMADEAAKKLAANVGKQATAMAAAKFGGLVGMAANSGTMEAGQIYPDAVEEAKKTGKPVDLGRVGLASLLAASLDVLPEARIGAKLLEGAGNQAGKSFLRRAATEIPKQTLFEGVTEGAQTPIEHWGAGKDPMAPENVKDTINSAAMGAVGGMWGGGLAAIPGGAKNPPKKVPEWIPGSPLTNAANVAMAQLPPGTPPSGTSPATPPGTQAGPGGTSSADGWGGYSQIVPFDDPRIPPEQAEDLNAKQQAVGAFLSDFTNERRLEAAGIPIDQARYVWQIVINNPDAQLQMRVDALRKAADAVHALHPAAPLVQPAAIPFEKQEAPSPLSLAPKDQEQQPGIEFRQPRPAVNPDLAIQGNGSFGKMDEFAQLVQSERADLDQRRTAGRFDGIRDRFAAGWVLGKGLTITNPDTGEKLAVSPAEKAHFKKLQKDSANGPATAPAATNAAPSAPVDQAGPDVLPGSPAVAPVGGNVQPAPGGNPAAQVAAPGSGAAAPDGTAAGGRPAVASGPASSPLSDADLDAMLDQAQARVDQKAAEPEPIAAGVTLDDVPAKYERETMVKVRRMVGSDVQTVEVSANEAIADLDEEISAYERLLDCVRSAA